MSDDSATLKRIIQALAHRLDSAQAEFADPDWIDDEYGMSILTELHTYQSLVDECGIADLVEQARRAADETA